MAPSRSHPQLDVGQALREGWQAFNQAPWLFVGFAVLLTALQFALQALQPTPSADRLPFMWSDLPGNDWKVLLPWLGDLTLTYGPLVFNLLVVVVLNLWGTCGYVRGAWVALGGGRPTVATFIRWDPRALLRLFLPGFLLGSGVIAVVVVGVLLVVVLSQVNLLLPLLPGVLVLAGLLYLSVSQSLLSQVALLHDDNPFAALARGPEVVDRVWGQVVVLALLNFALLLAGLLACCLGLFVATPLVICVATAAYRQLFGPDDRTGLTRNVLPAGR